MDKIEIVYVSSLCSKDVWDYIYKTSKRPPLQSVQKFHRLLIEGFESNSDISQLETLSAIPVIHSSHKKRIWFIRSAKSEKIKYNYLPFINLPLLRELFLFFTVFVKIFLKGLKSKKFNIYVICDVLNLSTSLGSMLACKITGLKIAPIVTDLPNFMLSINKNNSIKVALYRMIIQLFISDYDGYILLTEQMNNEINKKKKPYMIMEGLVDIKMSVSKNSIEKKAETKNLIYAGGIYKKYGLIKLIEAFMLTTDNSFRLIIYGAGDMQQLMTEYCNMDSRILYKGVRANYEVVQELIVATLLINPRPSDLELSKYSFPSKNMEYMVSGTPLLTTPLPGMPNEYNQYVYLFEDESIEGMCKTIECLLSKPKEELHEFGSEAKVFVLSEKSNIKQSGKILDFLMKL